MEGQECRKRAERAGNTKNREETKSEEGSKRTNCGEDGVEGRKGTNGDQNKG